MADEVVATIPGCQCEHCSPNDPLRGRSRMIVCEYCGNKRCPHATHHANDCTGSNEIGQLGSSWGSSYHKPNRPGLWSFRGQKQIVTQELIDANGYHAGEWHFIAPARQHSPAADQPAGAEGRPGLRQLVLSGSKLYGYVAAELECDPEFASSGAGKDMKEALTQWNEAVKAARLAAPTSRVIHGKLGDGCTTSDDTDEVGIVIAAPSAPVAEPGEAEPALSDAAILNELDETATVWPGSVRLLLEERRLLRQSIAARERELEAVKAERDEAKKKLAMVGHTANIIERYVAQHGFEPAEIRPAKEYEQLAAERDRLQQIVTCPECNRVLILEKQLATAQAANVKLREALREVKAAQSAGELSYRSSDGRGYEAMLGVEAALADAAAMRLRL